MIVVGAVGTAQPGAVGVLGALAPARASAAIVLGAGIGTLEVAGCPTPTASLDPRPVAPVIPVDPSPGKPSGGHVTPLAPKGTVKPVIVKANVSPATIYNSDPTTLSVVATDNGRRYQRYQRHCDMERGGER